MWPDSKTLGRDQGERRLAQAREEALPDKVRGLDLVYRAEGSRWKVLNRRGTRSLLFKERSF